jgi:hypothetical protein
MMHHVNKMHKGMAVDIEALGWFWGTIRTIIKQNLRTTIDATLGGGSVWECMVQGCGHFFSRKDPFKSILRKLTAAGQFDDGKHRRENSHKNGK